MLDLIEVFTMDVNLRLIDCDISFGRENVVKNNDDTYTIFLNTRYNHEQQLKSYEHAIKHILNNDFDKNNADYIEVQSH